MQRISTSTKSTDLFGAGKHGFKDGNQSLGIPPTDFNAEWCNQIQEEIANAIEAAGVALSAGNRSQLIDALIKKGLQQGYFNTATAGGTANAITANFTPAITPLVNGMHVRVRAASANTTATPTFKADAAAAKTIVKGSNEPLLAGDISGDGHWLELQYDSTLDKWVLLNPSTITATGLLSGNGWFEVPLVIGGARIKAIMQFAQGTNQSANGNQVINLPIAFPTAHLKTFVCNLYLSAAQNGGYGFISATLGAVTVARGNTDNGNGVTPLIFSVGY